MTRKLKGLVPVLIAALAALAVAASAAQAELTFVPEGESTAYLDGESIMGGETEFTLGEGRTVKCGKTGLEGDLKEPQTDLVIYRSYGECMTKILGTEYPTTIELGACFFHLQLTEESEPFTAKVDIGCSGELGIVINAYADKNHTELVCAFELPPQQEKEKVEIEDVSEEPPHMVIRPNVTNFKYERTHGNGLFCGIPAEGENATYKGSTTTKGTDIEGNPLGVYVS